MFTVWAGIVGAAVLLYNARNTHRTLDNSTEALKHTQSSLDLARQGQLTERFVNAVNQLGHDKEEVRSAALYSLRLLADDAPTHRVQCLLVIVSFIRSRTRKGKVKTDFQGDVQTAIDVLGSWGEASSEDRRLRKHDLSELSFSRYSFRLGFFPDCDFTSSTFHHCDFVQSELSGASFVDANCTACDFSFADLDHTDFSDANLSSSEFSNEDTQTNALISAERNRGTEMYWRGIKTKPIQRRLELRFFREGEESRPPHVLYPRSGNVANLFRNRMKGTRFDRATMIDTWLVASNLRETKGLTSDQLEVSMWNEFTILPEEHELLRERLERQRDTYRQQRGELDLPSNW